MNNPFAELHSDDIAAIIVTYNPDDSIITLVRKVSSFARWVFIVDNGSSDKSPLSACDAIEGAKVIKLNANIGVAAALNHGIDLAIQHECRFTALFDQDSMPIDEYLEEIQSTSSTWQEEKSIALIGVNYATQVGNKTLHGFTLNNDILLFETPTAITSGSLLCCKAFQQIGPFREEFFIDHVDHEYCLRARAKGYSILVVAKPLIQHMVGNVQLIPIGSRNILLTNHAPERRYYQRRNFIFLLKEFWRTEPKWCRELCIREFLGFITMLLEKDRFRKTQYSLLGLWDGLWNNYSRPSPL